MITPTIYGWVRDEGMPVTIGLLIMQVCCMTALQLLGVAYDYDSLALVFIVLTAVTVVMESPAVVKDKGLYRVLLAGLVLRLVLLFCDYYVMRIMHSGGDTEGFFFGAYKAAQNGTPETVFSYYKWLAYLFMFVGPAKLFAQYINLMCGIFSCLLMLKTFRLLGLSTKAQSIGFMLLCLLPNWVDMSVILLRESLIGFFVSLSLFAFVAWFQSGKARYVCAAVLAAVPAIDLHGGMVFMPIIIIAGYILYNAKKRKTRLNMAAILSLCVSLIIIVYVISISGLNKLSNISLDTITRISMYAVNDTYSAGSTYLMNLSTSSWLEVFLYTPIRSFYFFFSPLPMDFRGITDFIAFMLSSLPLVIIIGYAVYTLFTCTKSRMLLLFLLLTLVFGGVIYAWGTYTAGTAMRHRDKLTPLYVLIMAVAIDARANRMFYGLLPVSVANVLDRLSAQGSLNRLMCKAE